VSDAAFRTSNVRVQYGALPWRQTARGVEILLITTQTTRRWIIPKGWPVPGLRPSECAAHEVFEEAGVEGDISTRPLGSFRYEKRRKSGEAFSCKVEVFALEVMRQRRNWPERDSRDTRWCSVEEALQRVSDPGLAKLIVKFGKAADSAELEPARFASA
jgi:8-oxo-dGTP pyrophosphatase MutT (NUDIX family)